MGQNPAKQIFEVPSFWQDFILCISEKMCKGRIVPFIYSESLCFFVSQPVLRVQRSVS